MSTAHLVIDAMPNAQEDEPSPDLVHVRDDECGAIIAPVQARATAEMRICWPTRFLFVGQYSNRNAIAIAMEPRCSGHPGVSIGRHGDCDGEASAGPGLRGDRAAVHCGYRGDETERVCCVDG
jgi:hypothetical protein